MRSFNSKYLLLPLGLLLLCCSTGNHDNQPELVWNPMVALNAELPPGIRVYAGLNRRLPLRAWYVEVDEQAPDIATSVILAADSDRRETASSMAARLNADVIVNGGFFRKDLDPTKHVGLLMVDSTIIQPATGAVTREPDRFLLARAALGFAGKDEIDIAWVFNRHDTLFEIKQPPSHSPGQPAPASELYDGARRWPVREAVGGGPSLITDGEVRVTTDEEVFFGTSIPKVHPRTACGYTAEGKLILLVVDGRQELSRGVNLEELAHIMHRLGCVEALNLDGGGSSTLVVNGQLINRPTGGVTEREIMSALAVFGGLERRSHQIMDRADDSP